MSFKPPRFPWLLIVLFLIPTGSLFVLLSQTSIFPITDTTLLSGWLVCLLVFVLFDQLAGRLEDGLWAGYLYFIVLVTWLATGVLPTLILIFTGSIISNGIRLFPRVGHKSGETYVRWVLLMLMSGRIAILSLALLTSSIIFDSSGIIVPINAQLTLASLILMLPGLIGGLIVTQIVGLVILPSDMRETVIPKLFWSKGQRFRILQELVMLTASPVIALLLIQSGLIAFCIVLAIMGRQAFRYRDIQAAQYSLVRRVEQLSTFDSINRDLSSNLNFDDVLTGIYRRVYKFLDVSTFYIALYDPRLESVEFPLVIINGQRISHLSVEISQSSILETIIKQRRMIDTRTTSRENYDLFASYRTDPGHKFTAFAGLPLIFGEEVYGAICLGRHEGDAFTADDIRIAQTIAHQAGLAIRNSRLYNHSIDMSRNLARINKFMQEIVFSADLNTVVKTACAVALDISQADRVGVFLVDETDHRSLYVMHNINFPPAYEIWLMNQGANLQHSTMQTVTYTDLRTENDLLMREEAQIGEFRSKAEIPMRSGDTPMGVLIVYYNRPRYYDPSEVELLETLGSQIAAALDNAELLKVLEVYASEQAQLVHLSRTSTATLELEQVLDTVLTLMRHMLNVERVYVGLVDQSQNSMQFYGITADQAYIIRLSELAQVATLETIPQFYGLEDATPGLAHLMTYCGDEAIATTSLVVNNEFIGVVILGTPHHFGDAETRLLELAANQIAVQIHNARQYRQVEDALKRRLRQLALLENIARQISSALNVEQLISNVLDAAIQATQGDMAALGLVTETGNFQIIGREFVDGEWLIRRVIRSHSSGIMGRVARTRQRLIVEDNRREADYISSFTGGPYRSSLVVPLIKDEKVIGVLDIESAQIDFFKEEHAEFIESLAGHAVISIQNADLLQERQRQIDVLTGLRTLSLKLSSDTDRRSVVNEILQTALTVVQGESAVMYRYPEETNLITLAGSLRRTESGFSPARLQLPDILIQQVIESGERQIIHNIPDALNPNLALIYPDDKDGSLILAPIKHGNRVQEILGVTFARGRTTLRDELNTLELLLIQAAGHLENTVLYERVLEGNNRLRVFLDSSSDGIILLDAHGNLVQANVSAERMLGLSLGEHIGENFVTRLMENIESSDLSPDSREGLMMMARILRLEPEKITRRQFELRRRGQPLYLEEVSSPVFDAQNQIMGRLLGLRDITEEKLLMDYRDEISNMIIHDLRSPLSAIYSGLSYSRLLLDDSVEAPPLDVLIPVLDVAVNSTNNLLALVDSLLDIAKLESRSMPLKLTPTSITDMVNDAVVTMSVLFKEAEIVPELVLPHNLPNVYVDESKIRRVVLNLLDNAQRYSPLGGRVLIQAQMLEDNQKVLMRIVDSGKGIPAEERERIFDKFRQVNNNSPARGRRGSGLGLTFCKLVIEAHGEEIWVEEYSPLSGASFAFTLPIYTSTNEEQNEQNGLTDVSE